MKRADHQRGAVSLLEVAMVVGIVIIIGGALLPALTNVFGQVAWFRMESFKANATEAMHNYQRANIQQFTPAAAATVTIAAADLNGYAAAGLAADAGFASDPAGRRWHYVPSCVQTLAAPVSLAFCDFIGYTAGGSALSVALNDKTLAWYRGQAAVQELIYLSGRPAISEQVTETVRQLERVKIALENYYRALYLAAPDKGIGVNRYANASRGSGEDDETGTDIGKYLYDADSVLRNTEADTADDHLFTAAEAAAIGLAAADLLTPFGAIKFDNGSTAIRAPDNGHLPPYTVRLWVDLPGGVVIEKIAASVF